MNRYANSLSLKRSILAVFLSLLALAACLAYTFAGTFGTPFSALELVDLAVYLPFWLAGTVILLRLQPRDTRWQLLVLFDYLTALWLAMTLSAYGQTPFSALFLHALSWLLLPIYLHLHLTIPTPLWPRLNNFLIPALYTGGILGGILAAVLESARLMPPSAFNLPLVGASVGSLALLMLHSAWSKSASDRGAIRLMWMGIAVSLGPGAILVDLYGLLVLFGGEGFTAIVQNVVAIAPNVGVIALIVAALAIPSLPFFYLYANYKHRLGRFEFRVNRLLSLYSFVMIYSALLMLPFAAVEQRPGQSLVLAMVIVLAAIPLRPRYQRVIDRLAYGVHYNPDEITQSLTNRIPSALDRESLVALLTREVTPRLLIRRSALYLLREGRPTRFYADGITLDPHPHSLRALDDLLAYAGHYRPPEEVRRDEFEWVRLAIVLK
ncbi:MAG: hypothetical protein WCF84_15625, partial [Anaerolineae bacterium]